MRDYEKINNQISRICDLEEKLEIQEDRINRHRFGGRFNSFLSRELERDTLDDIKAELDFQKYYLEKLYES
ncbi:MAG: hypothetical protein ACI4WH_03260 [Oscillospiraceae bacterium]